MSRDLRGKLARLEGQPVKIFTDDHRIHKGIVLEVFDDAVQLIEKCGKLFDIRLCHIDAVEEPQMELRHCRRDEEEEDS